MLAMLAYELGCSVGFGAMLAGKHFLLGVGCIFVAQFFAAYALLLVIRTEPNKGETK